MAVAMLLGGVVLAQAKPDAGKKDQPPANPPQPSAEKPADTPANQPARQAEQPRDTQRRDQTQPRSADRANQPRQPDARQPDARQPDARQPGQRQPDARQPDNRQPGQRQPDARQPGQRQPEPDRGDRGTQRQPDRTDRDTTPDRRDADRGPRDRADQQRDTARRGEKEVKPSDLGLSFSEQTTDKGLKISKLSSRSIASKADFKEGDIIVSINDHRIASQRDFLHWLHAGRHDRITVIVLRDDREVTLFLEPDVIFQETVVAQGGAWLGVDLYDRFSRMAVVLKVHPNSPADRAGLRGDDVIIAVEGEEIRSPEHLGQVIGQMRPGDLVEIEVERNRRAQFVDATLASRETVSRRTEVIPRGRSLLPRR
jgi:hypothetical protein